jgi:hypothetical protein
LKQSLYPCILLGWERVVDTPPERCFRDSWFRISGQGFQVMGFGFRVSGLGLRVEAFGLRLSISGVWV